MGSLLPIPREPFRLKTVPESRARMDYQRESKTLTAFWTFYHCWNPNWQVSKGPLLK